MNVTTESGKVLHGDWRSGAYGANRKAHRFDWRPFASRESPVCGARISYEKTGAVRQRKLAELCYECLAYGAAGR
jgi:hypothetical protein